MALGVSMVAVVQTIPEFESERLMFERERDVGLNIYAYSCSMYNSYQEYQERVRSHKLLDVLPREKFHAPMTTNMGVGWADVDYKQVLDDIVPKKSCAETLYADAMVKAGVYYA